MKNSNKKYKKMKHAQSSLSPPRFSPDGPGWKSIILHTGRRWRQCGRSRFFVAKDENARTQTRFSENQITKPVTVERRKTAKGKKDTQAGTPEVINIS